MKRMFGILFACLSVLSLILAGCQPVQDTDDSYESEGSDLVGDATSSGVMRNGQRQRATVNPGDLVTAISLGSDNGRTDARGALDHCIDTDGGDATTSGVVLIKAQGQNRYRIPANGYESCRPGNVLRETFCNNGQVDFIDLPATSFGYDRCDTVTQQNSEAARYTRSPSVVLEVRQGNRWETPQEKTFDGARFANVAPTCTGISNGVKNELNSQFVNGCYTASPVFGHGSVSGSASPNANGQAGAVHVRFVCDGANANVQAVSCGQALCNNANGCGNVCTENGGDASFGDRTWTQRCSANKRNIIAYSCPIESQAPVETVTACEVTHECVQPEGSAPECVEITTRPATIADINGRLNTVDNNFKEIWNALCADNKAEFCGR